MPDDAATTKLVRRLSRYLRDNPLASDTPEGIARWWLQMDWVTNGRHLDEAIARLMSSGCVEGVRGPDGRVRYRRVQADGVAGILAALSDEPSRR
ncbi:MAG: hypothetical protein ACREPM_20135 [Gemmatimonadaceae bacterium]